MDLPEAIAATPWLLPVLLAALSAGVVVRRRVARILGCGSWVAVAVVGGAGLVLGATLTPGLGETFTPGSCLVGVDGSLTAAAWFRADLVRNLLLPAPLGFAVGLVPPPRRRWVLTAAVLLLVGVELAQLLAPTLGRACQVTDMAANGVGLLGASLLGALLRPALPRRGRHRDVPSPRPDRAHAHLH